MQKIGWLMYEGPYKNSRGTSASFLRQGNIGALVVFDILRRAGFECVPVVPRDAHQFDVVAFSLTSSFDYYNFLRAVGKLPEWQPGRRKFKVIAGGAGLNNALALRNYVDYAAYGRAEVFIANLVADAIAGRPSKSPHVLNLPEIRPVTYAQVDELYEHEVDVPAVHSGKWCEHNIGCHRCCYFCFYRYSRKFVSERETYKYSGADGPGGGMQIELTMLDVIEKWHGEWPRLLPAADGFSERLRFAFNKKISRDMIAEVGRHLADVWTLTRGHEPEKRLRCMVYNIANLPTETDEDRAELPADLVNAAPDGRVTYVLHSTPFRPSPLTPSAYLPVALFPAHRLQPGESKLLGKEGNTQVFVSGTQESPISQLMSLIIERATDPDLTDKILGSMLFGKDYRRQKTWRDKLRALSGWFDLDGYLRSYSLDEPLPTWYLGSYTKPATVRRQAKRLKGALGILEPGEGDDVDDATPANHP